LIIVSAKWKRCGEPNVGANRSVCLRIIGIDRGFVQFQTDKLTILEDMGTCKIPVERLDGAAEFLQVNYSIHSNTAIFENDFLASSGQLEWFDGDKGLKYVYIPIVNDHTPEWEERFFIKLSNSVNAAIGTNSNVQIVIIDDPFPISDEKNNSCLMASGSYVSNNEYVLLGLVGEPLVRNRFVNDQYIANAGFIYQEQAPAAYLTVENVETKPGTKNLLVPMTLDNETALSVSVSSLECQIAYDSLAGIELVGASVTKRSQDFEIIVQSNSKKRQLTNKVILYNTSGQQISPGIGPIIDLIFNVSVAAIEGTTSELSLNNCTLSDAQANLIPSYYSESSLFKILSLIPCDLTGDDQINILDLQMIINVIFGKEARQSLVDRSDIILDGSVNILDLQCMINKIIGKDCRSNKRISRKSDVNQISLPCLKLDKNQTGTFDISLSNNDNISSGQVRLIYSASSGFNITGIHLTQRTKGFETTFVKDDSDINNISILVLFYSLNDSIISKGSGNILTFDFWTSDVAKGKSKLQFTEAILSDAHANALPVHMQNGWIEIGEDEELLEAITLLKVLSGMNVHANFYQWENLEKTIRLADVILLLKSISL